MAEAGAGGRSRDFGNQSGEDMYESRELRSWGGRVMRDKIRDKGEKNKGMQ